MDIHIKQHLSNAQALRYSRQILLPGFDLDCQERLLNSRVLQIGVGGLGCASAQYLVAAGIGELTLIDDDRVELSNLQRQILHGDEDIDKTKCQSAKTSLQRLNQQVRINVIEQRLTLDAMSTQVAQHHLVLDCTDNLTTRNQLNQLCHTHHKPLVSGAAIRMEGQISSFVPASDNACYQCLSAYFGEQELSCVEAGVMSPVVGIIGAMQALEGIKLLSGFGKPLINKLLMFDAMTSQWREFSIPRKAGCPVCSQFD